MRVFVYEHITGGGYAEQPLPTELAHQGETMVRALLADLLAISVVEVSTLSDSRLAPLDARVNCSPVSSRRQNRAQFEQSVRQSDAVWLIAPETDGVLLNLARLVFVENRPLIGPSVEAITVSASKRATARCLASAGVATLPTYLHGEPVANAAGRWLTKPDDGCACADTRVHSSYRAANEWLNDQPQHTCYVMQPYMEGEAFSVSVCADRQRAAVLSLNRQHISVANDQLSFDGVDINVESKVSPYLQTLVTRVCEAVAGLQGYFGIDLIYSAGEWCVVEINPRLTTSYVGLSAAIGANVAAKALQCALGEWVPSGRLVTRTTA